MPLGPSGETAVLSTIVTGRYVGLHTAQPSGVNEVAGGSYARQAVPTFSNAGTDPTVASNDSNIEFPLATASWGTITHVGLWDAASGGNLIAWQALDDPKTIAINDVFRFLAGNLTVSAD